MKIFDVEITYEKNDGIKHEEVIRVTANGSGKAMDVAIRSFNNKHKKELSSIVSTTCKPKQVIKENEEI